MNQLSTALKSGGQRGFTLVETSIVIIILGILATVVIFAVNAIRDRGAHISSGVEHTTGVIRALNDDMVSAVNALVDADDPNSTQSLAMALVVNAVDADPASGQLDPVALRALYDNILDRERVIRDLIARIDELLATSDRPKDRLFLMRSRNDLVQILDGLRKIKAVIRSRAVGTSAPGG